MRVYELAIPLFAALLGATVGAWVSFRVHEKDRALEEEKLDREEERRFRAAMVEMHSAAVRADKASTLDMAIRAGWQLRDASYGAMTALPHKSPEVLWSHLDWVADLADRFSKGALPREDKIALVRGVITAAAAGSTQGATDSLDDLRKRISLPS